MFTWKLLSWINYFNFVNKICKIKLKIPYIQYFSSLKYMNKSLSTEFISWMFVNIFPLIFVVWIWVNLNEKVEVNIASHVTFIICLEWIQLLRAVVNGFIRMHELNLLSDHNRLNLSVEINANIMLKKWVNMLITTII